MRFYSTGALYIIIQLCFLLNFAPNSTEKVLSIISLYDVLSNISALNNLSKFI